MDTYVFSKICPPCFSQPPQIKAYAPCFSSPSQIKIFILCSLKPPQIQLNNSYCSIEMYGNVQDWVRCLFQISSHVNVILKLLYGAI